jgi:hypothetical protein
MTAQATPLRPRSLPSERWENLETNNTQFCRKWISMLCDNYTTSESCGCSWEVFQAETGNGVSNSLYVHPQFTYLISTIGLVSEK